MVEPAEAAWERRSRLRILSAGFAIFRAGKKMKAAVLLLLFSGIAMAIHPSVAGLPR
jgi:hypothetical protein